MNFRTRFIYLLSIAGFAAMIFNGCEKKENADPAYVKSINDWHAKRISNLKKEGGWLNLAGLFWLQEGDNSFGSSKDNKIVFPAGAPEKIGVFTLHSGKITFHADDKVNVIINSKPQKDAEIKDDMSGDPTVMQTGSFRWTVIKRQNQYGIRLRDLNSPLVKSFEGVDRFDINPAWKINAKFVKYDSAKIISIPNILGSTEDDTVKGELRFTVNNKSYSLIPVSEGDELFLIFADETNGEETYGAGRFLYAEAPDSSGNVVLDFNKAYNPPCAFTKYATCPLPPKENYLHIKIIAGEKKYGEGH